MGPQKDGAQLGKGSPLSGGSARSRRRRPQMRHSSRLRRRAPGQLLASFCSSSEACGASKAASATSRSTTRCRPQLSPLPWRALHPPLSSETCLAPSEGAAARVPFADRFCPQTWFPGAFCILTRCSAPRGWRSDGCVPPRARPNRKRHRDLGVRRLAVGWPPAPEGSRTSRAPFCAPRAWLWLPPQQQHRITAWKRFRSPGACRKRPRWARHRLATRLARPPDVLRRAAPTLLSQRRRLRRRCGRAAFNATSCNQATPGGALRFCLEMPPAPRCSRSGLP